MKKFETQRFLEPDIKAQTLNFMIKKGLIGGEETIINEFTLDGYSRRVDLVVASEKHLAAVEIKSEADSLQRLEGQINKYLEYFDKVIIVAASKHISEILKVVPERVAVWEANDGSISIKKRGKIAPIKNREKFLELMRVSALLKLKSSLGLTLALNNRKSLERALIDKAPLKVLRAATLFDIKSRYSLTSAHFWKKIENGDVCAEHIDALSLYKNTRITHKMNQDLNREIWNSIQQSYEQELSLVRMAMECEEPLFGAVPEKIDKLLAA